MNCHQNMCSNNCCQVQPMVMPTQIVTRRQISFLEQPVIYPVEYRTVNQVVLIPRCYRVYQQPCNPCNCQKQQ